MAGKAIFAALLVAAALVPLAGMASADHGGCPPFERLRYDYVTEFHHGGDLYSSVHVVGFTIFRFCFEARHQVTQEDLRFDARGGAYHLRIVGDGFEDSYLLRDAENATRWYPHEAVRSIRVVGLSEDAKPTVIPDEEPPALVPLLRR